MRKLGLLLILFLVVGAFAFAADMTVEERVAALEANSAIVPVLDGSAILTFGYDLQKSQAGFKNEASASATITWYDDSSVNKSGDGWYGYIEITDIYLNIAADLLGATPTIANSGDNGTAVSAKITNGSIYAKIYGAPGSDIEDVAGVDVATDNITAASPAFPAFAVTNTVQGVTLGYGSGMISDVSLGLASDGTWTQNTGNDFAIRIDADIVPMDLLEVKASLLYGEFSNATLGFGLSPIITVSSIMSGLTVTIGFDGAMVNGGSLTYDASVQAALNLAAENSDGNTDNVAVKLYYSSGQTDASIAAHLYDNAGFLPNTGVTAIVSLLDLTGTLQWGLELGGDYNKGGINPYFDFKTDSTSVNQVNVGVSLGSDLHGIDNTTFTLDYTTTDLANNTGLVTFKTEIDF